MCCVHFLSAGVNDDQSAQISLSERVFVVELCVLHPFVSLVETRLSFCCLRH